jgi:uncharacterized membrane protein
MIWTWEQVFLFPCSYHHTCSHVHIIILVPMFISSYLFPCSYHHACSHVHIIILESDKCINCNNYVFLLTLILNSFATKWMIWTWEQKYDDMNMGTSMMIWTWEQKYDDMNMGTSILVSMFISSYLFPCSYHHTCSHVHIIILVPMFIS